MIEMLGVLAIIGVLSVGGIAGYSKAMTKFKTNKVAEQVATIVTNIKTLYAQQKSYKGLNEETAVSMGIIPDELGTDYNNLTNPLNGKTEIYAWSMSLYKVFLIRYGNLPREACIALSTTDWGASQSSDLVAIDVSNTEVNDVLYMVPGCEGKIAGRYGTYTACSGGSVLSVPMSPQYAAEACNCKGNTCSIMWGYQ